MLILHPAKQQEINAQFAKYHVVIYDRLAA
jgi:hypothetical protein